VYLAEGPWTGKAYFDALRRARQRDASLFLDYGFTRPDVISRGPHPQVGGASTGAGTAGPVPTTAPNTLTPEGTTPLEPGVPGEPIPTPAGEPVSLSSLGPVNMVEFVEPLPGVAEPSAEPAPASQVVPGLRIVPAPAAAPSAGGVPIPATSAGSPTAPANPFLSSAPASSPTAAYEFEADHTAAQVAANVTGG
jgi:hypothetical protein